MSTPTTNSPPPPPSSPPASEIIGNNDDLLTEILTNIPIKPLLRNFKLVNKQWNSLISHDSSFSLLHSSRHLHLPSSALFFLHHHHHHHRPSSIYDFLSFSSSSPSSSSSPHFPPFFSLLETPPIDILQSSNGLLLCSTGDDIFVCNPTTNQIVRVELGFDNIVGFNLVFDPALSPHYHVVSVCEFKSQDNDDNVSSYSINVYSSNTKKWRVGVVEFFGVPFDVEFVHGVYWEGRIHWLSHTESTIFFDFEDECVRTLALPKAIQGSYIERFRYFGESCGHLHLIEIRTNCVQEFDVLELDSKNKTEWLVKYRVNLDVLGRGFEYEMFQDHRDRFGHGFRFYAFSILAVVRDKVGDDEDGDDSKLVISIPGKVISYNFRTKVSTLMCNMIDESDKLFPFRGRNAFQYIESLYRP